MTSNSIDTADSEFKAAYFRSVFMLLCELQERRKADSENLLKERQRVIDGLCTIGETAWEIEECMKKWDAEHLPKTSMTNQEKGNE
ncbi:hypothetical protein FDX19_15485 [Citrobacter sp. wls619]|uniref:hypothetical protein n=1 Tax=Citrobacter sp. wls619 TaxID=2576432 RepID=UPI0010C96D5B|nr:hypothetical protein [Citrobacter sp. wls619]TKV08238.1 hypothetical protein FDX19_15485 [Citrobacter sp. wls619]